MFDSEPPAPMPPLDQPEIDDEGARSGRSRPKWLIPVVAVVALVALLAIVAVALVVLGGSNDPEPTSSLPPANTDPAATESTEPADATTTSTTTTSTTVRSSDPVTLSGVVALPGGSDCAELGSQHRVRVLDDAGEQLAVTPLIDERPTAGHCEFDYWVRLRTSASMVVFQLVGSDGATLDERPLDGEELTSGNAPALSGLGGG